MESGTTRKLTEARHFLDRMRAAEDEWNEDIFSHELSAFLSAARSVLQYLYVAARGSQQQQWYESAIRRSPVIGFLKDERDFNVHERPSAVAGVESNFGDGSPGSCDVQRRFFLWGWHGSESAVELAEVYLDAIEAVLRDARSRSLAS